MLIFWHKLYYAILSVYNLILDDIEFEEQGECFLDIRHKIFISGKKTILVYGMVRS